MPIHEIHENLHLLKITHYMVYVYVFNLLATIANDLVRKSREQRLITNDQHTYYL